MAVVAIEGHWFSGGSGYTTIDVNIAPAWIYATVCLHGTSGEGTSYAGIKHYRKRLSSGDEDHDFGNNWEAWPQAYSTLLARSHSRLRRARTRLPICTRAWTTGRERKNA